MHEDIAAYTNAPIAAGQGAAAQRGVITWEAPAPGSFGSFSACLVLDDGSRHDFSSPFELARFLGTSVRERLVPPPGLR